MSVYCVRSWSSLYEPNADSGDGSGAPSVPNGSGQSATLDNSITAGEDLLARFGLTDQLRQLRSRQVPDKYRFAVKHLPCGAVDSCLSDRRLRKTLRELLEPLPEGFHTGFPQDGDQKEHTMKCIAMKASKAPPVNTLGPLELETITPNTISALALSDTPLVLNPLKLHSKKRAAQAAQPGQVPQTPAVGTAAVQPLEAATTTTPMSVSPAVQINGSLMPNAALATKRPHEALPVTPGESYAAKRARLTKNG